VSAAASPLVSAVLPDSRSVQVGASATAFATIINTGSVAALGCRIAPIPLLPASFSFQTTNRANAPVGTPNTPANIAAGAFQRFVISFTPTASIVPTNVILTFSCVNTSSAPIIVGINTLLLSSSSTPVPDIIALAATPGQDGIVNVPGPSGRGVFSVATVDVGTAAAITVSADTGGMGLPIAILLSQPNPATGECMHPTVPSLNPVVTNIATNATPTFGIFVTGAGMVPFDPTAHRVFIRFRDAGGVVRGSTSVAVRTQ